MPAHDHERAPEFDRDRPRLATHRDAGLAGSPAAALIDLQRSAGNRAAVTLVRGRGAGRGSRGHARAGWRPISGTGCAHWVAHQRGGPTGTAHSCRQNFKYRVTELLATLTQASADLSGAVVGAVWSASGSSHVGIVRAVTRDATSTAVVSVQVENDSSASGGVVTQTKTDGSIYT